jgi:CDP-diacylglycerol--glycerol-3-phosphate 3-phosphatidyltransferase
MLLVPVFFWLAILIHTENSLRWATVVFIIAAITDYFDGMLARRYNAITDFGKVMDPLADKLLVLIALLAITLPPLKLITVYAFYIILTRELLVSLMRNYYIRRKIYIPANIWGKLKTIFQITGIIITLLYHSFLSQHLVVHQEKIRNGFHISFWVIAIITFLSGISYIFDVRKILKTVEKQNNA